MAGGVDEQVAAILADVRARGDAAVADYTRNFDGREPDDDGGYELPRTRWELLAASVGPVVREALELAARRIRAAHERQREQSVAFTLDGVALELRVTPLARAGLYVPGGTARYPSSVLMTAIPAKVAGVDRVCRLCGAQVVEELAYATKTVQREDKIGGPDSAWAAPAKRDL